VISCSRSTVTRSHVSSPDALIKLILIVGCLAALLAACYGPALSGGRQFGYRDAANYYYPLHWRVQAEWSAGRWPLWEPGENAGVPLLGNPTAAVLYPVKVIFALTSYPSAARLYVVAHTLLAFAGMLALLRGWGASWTGSTLAGLGYAFGAPVLFQYCNVIYLVGASWAPLGFLAVDAWLRRGRGWGWIGLSVVLAMMILGGDVESAYLLGVCAGGYALGLAWSRRTRAGASPSSSWVWWAKGIAGAIGLLLTIGWVTVTLELAAQFPALRNKPPFWMVWASPAILSAWVIAGLIVLARGRLKGREREAAALGTMLLGLAGAAVLAAVISAAQLLPVLEFLGQTGRSTSEGNHDFYAFSLEPIRLVELVWPGVFGTHFDGNRSWLEALRPATMVPRIWVPSLYLGGLIFILAAGALGMRGGGPRRAWLSAVAVVSILASLGEYTGPLWWSRWNPAVAQRVGPHDVPFGPTIRDDGKLRDGDGGFYWFLTRALPGFRMFRFPSKLLSYSALALTALAGLGWDRLGAGEGRRRTLAIAAALLTISLLGLAAVTLQRPAIVAALRASPASTLKLPLGAFEPEGAYEELRRSLAHGSIVLAIALGLLAWPWPWRGAPRRPAFLAALALAVTTADLAAANARLVLTVPQSMLDAKPKVVEVIEAAERESARLDENSPGPFRVHRFPAWFPQAWEREPGTNLVHDAVVWGNDTIEPKYGLRHDVQYTMTLGMAEIYDYEWFFGPIFRRVDATMAKQLGLNPGAPVIVFPKRAFDMWNTRYIVLPVRPNGWNDETRGYASFLLNTERIFPRESAFQGPGGADRSEHWAAHQDFQVFRSRTAYPRAWVVHAARFLTPIVGLNPNDRVAPMKEILYSAEPLWRDPSRTVYDARSLAWLDSDKRQELAEFLPGDDPSPSELPTITSYGTQTVEIDVALKRPGLVILADLYYPGWRLKIDGRDAPIYRANRMMRAAAVKEGRHHLTYTYEPQSFRIGAAISLAGLAVLAILATTLLIRPRLELLFRVGGPRNRVRSVA
jgi:Bacterial membrane protein YfhO